MTARPTGFNPATLAAIPAITVGVQEVEVVVAHSERATLRVGEVDVLRSRL